MSESDDKLRESMRNLQSMIESGVVVGPEEQAMMQETTQDTPEPVNDNFKVDLRYADLEEVPPESEMFDENGDYTDEHEEDQDESGEHEEDQDESGEPAPDENSKALALRDEQPPYMGDEFPKTMSDQVKWYLIRGEATPEDLVANGYSHGTVRNAISFLKSKGLYQPKALVKSEKQMQQAKSQPRVPVKGSPPELLIAGIEMPDVGNGMPQFEKGMKAGMALLVTAVRIVQELGSIGLQQAQPLVKMAAEMRAGEAAAAKSAAYEAGTIAASDVKDDLLPILAQLAAAREPAAAPPPPKTRDEAAARMQDKMMRAVEPLFDRLINKAIPGAAGAPTIPSDWSIESK